MMPGMDGIEALQLIRALDGEYAKTIPVIALTANAVVGNEQIFIENGFQAFLSKPVSLTKLDAVIREWIMKDAQMTEYVAPSPPPRGADIEIPGVDSEQGMYLFEGDREMFIDFLRSYADNVPAELDKLRDVSEQTLSAYAIDVHTIKGASAGIGADESANYAKRLEKMAKTGDLSGVLLENEAFLKAVDTLVSDIRAWFANNE
jgi:HPt (histidine-containing phosphotransfer) domain-containing protein